MNRKICCFFALLFSTVSMPSLAENDGPCKIVTITFSAGENYWRSWKDDNRQIPSQPWHARFLEWYFVGDPIFGRLYVASGCEKNPIVRDDLIRAIQCLSISAYKMAADETGTFRSENEALRATLGLLQIDEKDPWNRENEKKEFFFATEASSEGLFSKFFILGKVLGKELPKGIYLLEIVASEKCDYGVRMNAPRRWIKIVEADTPQLKALKLCREAGVLVKQRKNDIRLWQTVIEEKIMPALKIYPNAPCALQYLARYHRALRNKSEYERHYRLACEASEDNHFREACLRSLRLHLDNWDNPKWWVDELDQQQKQPYESGTHP